MLLRNGIGALDDVLLGRLDGRRGVVLLHLEVLGTRAVSRAAVADAVLVLRHGLEHGRRAGHGLRARGEILTLKHVLLEELVGAGAVLAAIDGDGGIRSTHFLPVLGLAVEDVSDLRHGEFLHRVIGADIHGEAVEAHLVFRRALAEGLDAGGDLRRLDLARGIAEVGGACSVTTLSFIFLSVFAPSETLGA